MKLKNLNWIFNFSLLIIVIISIISCNKDDNPVSSSNIPNIVDSNYFDSLCYTIYVDPANDIYIADTNQILIPANPYSVFMNNGTINYINHNDNNFVANCADGTNINNVYIGGMSGPDSKPKLKKWDGNGITDIPLPYDTTACICSIVMVSENDIWMGTEKNFVFHYVNGSFSIYKFDENIVTSSVYKDNDGGLFILAWKYIQNAFIYQYIYKYENNIWNQIYKDSVTNNTEMGACIGSCGGKILRNGKSGIYCFDGYIWEKYVNIPSAIGHEYLAAGGNSTDILFHGEYNYNYIQDYLFYYNGNVIYKLPLYGYPNICYNCIRYKFGRYYITTNDCSCNNRFVILKFKK